MSTAFLVALCLVIATIPVAAVSRRVAAVLALAASLLYLVVGFVSAGGWSHASIDLGTWFGFGPAALVVDRLAGLFLALAGAAGAAVSATYLEHPPKRFVTALHGLLLLAMATVIGANQAFVFLLGWELLTLTLYLLAGADRERPGTLFAGYFTGAMNKLGGAALLAAFALLYAHTGSFEFSDWAALSPGIGSAVRGVAFALLLVGFGTKVGMMPFQGWLPVGHAAAPGAASATLSGIAINAGFYGLWRLAFETVHPASLWWGDMTLVIGGLSALVGILYAIGQDDLKRFLGFSTIEHSGIVLIGFGVALVGSAADKPTLAAAGLVAATLHLIAHALAKTLAFLGADRVARGAGTRELAPLGGLARRLPKTATGFGLATLTLAAVPPFAGFVSEWLTFEALLQAFRIDNTPTRLLMALGAALLALTAGLALLAFAKVYGTVFLGRPRRADADEREPSDPGTGLVALTAVAILLGAAAPWEVQWVGLGLQGMLGFNLAATTVTHPLVLGPVYADFSVLAPTWLSIVLPTYAILAGVLVWWWLRPPLRRAPVWISGTDSERTSIQYTPAGYSNPVRHVLRGLYGYRRRVRLDPPPRAGGRPKPTVETRLIPGFEHYLYAPVTAAALWLSAQSRRLQSGRLGLYLLYMLLVLLAALALIPALRS
jgi:hydrogenase-4 component B